MDYRQIIHNYVDQPGGLIEAYHALQQEFSYLPEEAIVDAAEAFKMSAEEAYGVATFYSMFSVNPRGRNIIRICASAPCHIAGAGEVVKALEKELGIHMGETTADGQYTLEFTECVGQCQGTPVITINGQPFMDVSPAKIPALLNQYRA
jgi:NADH-quinone oxidoreductase subunit E